MRASFSRLLTGLVAAAALTALLAAACGDDDSTTATTPTSLASSGTAAASATGTGAGTQGVSSATTSAAQTASSTAAAALPAVCGLPTAAQLTAALGAAPGDGVAQDYEPTYRTCGWNVVPAGSTNANAVRLGVILKTKATDNGFAKPTLPNSAPVSGLGDSATMYTQPGTFAQANLIVNDGPYSLSVSGQYGGEVPAFDAAQTALIDIARTVLQKLKG
jgi:hypothetical protein